MKKPEAGSIASAVERYYEVAWIGSARARDSTAGLPIEAGRLASEGRPGGEGSSSRRSSGMREQLGMRPTTAALYQGYPFDRLRRRLGLAPTDPDAIDPHDTASMSGSELDKLDPNALDDYNLAEAYESAAALGADVRTARFASVLALPAFAKPAGPIFPGPFQAPPFTTQKTFS